MPFRCKFYTSHIDTNVASHRLRCKPAIVSELSIIKERSLISLIDLAAESAKALLNQILFSQNSSKYKVIIFFSKPYSNGDFLYLLLAIILGPCFPIVIDICDLPDQALTSSSQLGGRFLSLLLKLSTATTASTHEIAREIYKRYKMQPIVIADCIDLESFPVFNFTKSEIILPKRQSRRLLWFGNSGMVDSSGSFILSKSFERFYDIIFRLESSESLRKVMRSFELVVCANNTPFAENLFVPIIDKGQKFLFVPWCLSNMQAHLASASLIMLTYGLDFSSTLKSPNRIQLAMSAMVPVLVVNPPPSIYSFLDRLDPACCIDLNLFSSCSDLEDWLLSHDTQNQKYFQEEDLISYHDCCARFNSIVSSEWQFLWSSLPG